MYEVDYSFAEKMLSIRNKFLGDKDLYFARMRLLNQDKLSVFEETTFKSYFILVEFVFYLDETHELIIYLDHSFINHSAYYGLSPLISYIYILDYDKINLAKIDKNNLCYFKELGYTNRVFCKDSLGRIITYESFLKKLK